MSRNPKTLAVSPTFATELWPSFKQDLARMIPRIENGIESEVRRILPNPKKKGRETNILTVPKIRLKNPLKE